MSRSLASCIEASTAALVSGVAAQAETFAGSSPALVTALFRVSVAPSAVAKAVLPFKHRSSKLEEGGAAGLLRNADAHIRAAITDCGMNARKRIVLEDDARLGKVGDELVHVGLRGFAMRALEVGELDEFEILRS